MTLLRSIKTYIGLPVRYFYFFIAAFVAALIIIKSIDYLTPDFTNGFLLGRENVFEKGYKYALYVHMFTGPVTIFTGILQFILKRTSKIHRVSGYFYIVGTIVASISGLYMSFYSIGGIASGFSFFTLAVLWFYFTVRAFASIRKNNVEQHRRFMTRSFILANSAIALRLLAFLFNSYTQLEPVKAYIIVAWLCWVPWLLIYEVSLFASKKMQA